MASGPPGQVATLVLPADVSWSEGGVPGRLLAPAQATHPPTQQSPRSPTR
jgi:acetolactate synthase-1/2/3 large subunit